MKDRRVLRISLLFISILGTLLFGGVLFLGVIKGYILFESAFLKRGLLVGFAVMLILNFGMFVYWVYSVNKEEREQMIYLSDRIASMIDLQAGTNNDSEMLCQDEDTLLSKTDELLQKLVRILKRQRKEMEQGKLQVESNLSEIGHQLKTPLANLELYHELLQDEMLSREERKEYEVSERESLDKLVFLVNALIKMSRLEQGIIQVKRYKQSICTTVLQALKQIAAKAEQKHIMFTYYAEREEMEVFHDRNWTVEAIYNLMDNAVKYSKENSQVQVQILEYELFCRIDIIDEGIGILEEEQAQIFSRFYRGKEVSGQEGLGIGLSIAKEIITTQNGYIKVSSLEQGTKFSVFLPWN